MTETAINLGEPARIGVVIPARDEAARIEAVVRSVPEYVSHVVVVDDGSRDGTSQVVEQIGDGRVSVLRNERSLGVGGAVKAGIRALLEVGVDVIVKMDGDGQMAAEDLPALLQPVLTDRADFSKGNRFRTVSAVRAMPLARLIGNTGLTFCAKVASGYWNLFDPSNGYLAVRAELFDVVDLEALPDSYYFETGLLIELGIAGAVVVDVPMTARYGDEVSGLSLLGALFAFPPRLIWGLVRRIFWRYVVHDFTVVTIYLAVGTVAVLGGVGFGLAAWAQMAAVEQYASSGVVMLAALPIILGVQLLLQAVARDIDNVPSTPLCPPLRRPLFGRSLVSEERVEPPHSGASSDLRVDAKR